MEKKSVYPEMPPLPGMPDVPPPYDQSYHYPTAPSADMPQRMTSGAAAMPMQPQQQQLIGQPQPTSILIQSLPPIPPLGPRSCLVTCPCCHQQQMSDTRLESTTKTHLFALLLCVVGLCCCACIPYCVDSCKNTNHYCRNCNSYLGTYNK